MRAGAGGGAAFALVSCAMLLLSAQALQAMGASSSTTSTTTTSAATPSSLLVSVVPPELPADGGTYHAIVISLVGSGGAASLALNDTDVFLTTSQESVGNVTEEVTIQRGAAFGVANLTTTDTPGVTSISASSTGLGAASAQVTTLTPSGFATSLSVIPVPGTQLVNPTGQGVLMVETLDSAGLPAQVSSDVQVTLSSSSTVLSLPSASLTLPSGTVLSSVPYYVGVSPGAATITASASGFRSGSGTVTVQGASPFALKIFAQPDPIATATTGRLVITLTDPTGAPAPAPATVSVTITSSNTTVVSSAETATIPTGQIYAVASFTSGPTAGTANLTASSPGLVSDYALVTVSPPVVPTQLTLIAAPDPVLADQSSYQSVMVLLTDAGGEPAVASSGVSVTLTSSDAAVGSVTGHLVIPAGSSYAVAGFSSTYFVGSTFITASAENLQSATATMSSYGPVPTEVVVQALPSTLPADGGEYSALEVMLEGANGLPAVAPEGVPIQLASSATGIATVNSTVVIPAGLTYVLTDVGTTISPGTATIAASSSGFQSSSTTVTTASPAPSRLGMYLGPSNGIQSLGRGDAILAVQLQDSNSSPARARQDTQVLVTSSNSSVIGKPIDLDIPAGADYAWALVTTSQAGSSTLTASAGGLSSASATLSELSVPVSVTLTSSAPVVAIGTPAIVQIQVEVMGSPLQGANVTLTSTSGSMSSPGGVTNSAGQFSDTFIPTQNGIGTVTALVQDPVLGNQTTGINILVAPPGAEGVGGSTGKGLGVIGTILPIVLVIVVVAIIVLGARRMIKKRSGGSDEYEEKEADS
jgi:hypothetical protein